MILLTVILSVLFLTKRNPLTASSSVHYSDHPAIVHVREAYGCLRTRPWFLTILVIQVCAEFHVICFFITLKYGLKGLVGGVNTTSVGFDLETTVCS